MLPHSERLILLAAVACLPALGTAQAADTFTWDPKSLKLNGKQFTADTLVLGDYARITFSFDGQNTTFLDKGYMPIVGLMLAGQTVQAAGFNAPRGAGWGAYIDYTATGIQTFSDTGVPVSATFTRLDYRIVGYNGDAVFSLGLDGTPQIGGSRRQVTTIGTGSLIQGGLEFSPGLTGLAIAGLASTTFAVGAGQPADGGAIGFDVGFVHPASEYVFRPDLGGILIPGGGTSSAATYRILTQAGVGDAAVARAALLMTTEAAVDVPEPSTALLTGAGLLGLSLLRRRSERHCRGEPLRG